MGLRDSLEAKAKKWALDKANELLGDKSPPAEEPEAASTSAPASAAAVASDADVDRRADVGEQVARRLFPGLGDWADKQKAQQDLRRTQEAAQRRAEIAALPKAEVRVSLAGSQTGHWWGELPVRLEVRKPPAEPDEFEAADPLIGDPTLVVELTPQDDARPMVGSLPMSLWRITVPAYHGDGDYDLVALVGRRTAAGFEPPYDDTWIDLGAEDDADSDCYFYADAGPSSVTVSDEGRRLRASISMSGALGTVVGTLEVSLPPTPAAG